MNEKKWLIESWLSQAGRQFAKPINRFSPTIFMNWFSSDWSVLFLIIRKLWGNSWEKYFKIVALSGKGWSYLKTLDHLLDGTFLLICYFYTLVKSTIYILYSRLILRRFRVDTNAYMVFCYQNCSDLLWDKIVLVIEKNFWNLRLKAKNLQKDHQNNLFEQWKDRTFFVNRMLF